MPKSTTLKKLDQTHRVNIANKFIDEAAYDLTKTELQCFFSVLSVIEPSDTSAKKIRFDGQDLIEHFGKTKDKNAFKNIALAFETLKRKEFYMVKFDKRNKKRIEREVSGNFLSSVENDYKQKYIEVEISEKMQVFIHSLSKHFLSYQIFEIMSLKSKYSIRFYVTANRHLGASETERFISKAELKERYQIEEKYMAKFSDLKRRVLTPSQKEVSAKTSVAFDMAVVRSSNGRGGKIEGVLLKNIRENRMENHLITQMIEKGVSERDASKIFARGFSQIRNKNRRDTIRNHYKGDFESFLKVQIDYVLAQPHDHFIKYLRAAIQKDFGHQFFRENQTKEKKLNNIKSIQEKINNCRLELDKLEIDYQKESHKICLALLRDNQELRKEIQALASQYPFKAKWTKDIMESLDHPFAKGFVFDKISQKFPVLFQTSQHSTIQMKRKELKDLEGSLQQTIAA